MVPSWVNSSGVGCPRRVVPVGLTRRLPPLLRGGSRRDGDGRGGMDAPSPAAGGSRMVPDAAFPPRRLGDGVAVSIFLVLSLDKLLWHVAGEMGRGLVGFGGKLRHSTEQNHPPGGGGDAALPSVPWQRRIWRRGVTRDTPTPGTAAAARRSAVVGAHSSVYPDALRTPQTPPLRLPAPHPPPPAAFTGWAPRRPFYCRFDRVGRGFAGPPPLPPPRELPLFSRRGRAKKISCLFLFQRRRDREGCQGRGVP